MCFPMASRAGALAAMKAPVKQPTTTLCGGALQELESSDLLWPPSPHSHACGDDHHHRSRSPPPPFGAVATTAVVQPIVDEALATSSAEDTDTDSCDAREPRRGDRATGSPWAKWRTWATLADASEEPLSRRPAPVAGSEAREGARGIARRTADVECRRTNRGRNRRRLPGWLLNV